MRPTLLVLAAVLAVSAPAARAQTIELGHIPECLQAVPAAVSAPVGDPLDLRVLLVADGIDPAHAEAVLAEAAAVYAPLGLNLVSAGAVALPLAGEDAGNLRRQARARLGGGRPPGADLVYVLTSADLSVGGDRAVSGEADCIGGVAFGDRAFAAGEGDHPRAAQLLAHELGHLMGGHHHHANCLQGIPAGVAELRPCTLMFPRLAYNSPVFGSLEAAVVRGHANAYLPGAPHPGAAVPPQPRSSPPPPASAPAVPRVSARCRTARRRLATARRRVARRATPRRRAALRRARRLASRAC